MKWKDEPRIFIVEDNLMYQQLIAKELESLSGDIYFFTKGEQCLKALHQNPAIVILDYNLEGVINGLDTLQAIRECNNSIYIILFSSQKSINSSKNHSRYGSFVYLEKKKHSFSKLKDLIEEGWGMAS
ncbi:MAG TPA: response regulator [Puia sp.]|nr:response regulator [Puia sp.]